MWTVRAVCAVTTGSAFSWRSTSDVDPATTSVSTDASASPSASATTRIRPPGMPSSVNVPSVAVVVTRSVPPPCGITRTRTPPRPSNGG